MRAARATFASGSQPATRSGWASPSGVGGAGPGRGGSGFSPGVLPCWSAADGGARTGVWRGRARNLFAVHADVQESCRRGFWRRQQSEAGQNTAVGINLTVWNQW
jgi:hypothetical protein